LNAVALRHTRWGCEIGGLATGNDGRCRSLTYVMESRRG
jgi:hypothetical protein